MLISIIIPVYNKEKLLNECIKSVVYQEYRDIEIIIINDGSTDNSSKIIKDWLKQDTRIKYINQTNKGVAAARNKGISIANGEYIFFLDADDYLEKDALQKLVSYARETNAEITIGNIYEKQDGKIVKKPKFPSMLLNEKDLIKTEIKLEMFIINHRLMAMAGNKLYKLDFIKGNSIKFEQGILAEDRLFNLLCYVNNPLIQIVNEYTYIYNKLDNSRSRNFNPNFYKESIALPYQLYSYLNKELKFEQNYELFQLVVIYDVNRIVSRTFKNEKQKKTMTNAIIKRLREDPLVNETLNNMFQQQNFKRHKGSHTFTRMRLISFLLLKMPYTIITLKYVERLARVIRDHLFGK